MAENNVLIYAKGITIVGDINELKELSQAIEDLRTGEILELPNRFSDLMFAIDSQYQEHHSLDCDNWDIVHKY